MPPSLPYVYTALGVDEIRVLYVDSTDDGSVQCRLETVALIDAEYVALSWCWNYGDLSSRAITVNGAQMSIQANAIEMLRQIDDLSQRLNHRRLPYWIDTVCINQHPHDEVTKAEKVSQIKLQGRIYGHASSVLVWLGPSDEEGGSDMIMTLLQYLSFFASDQESMQRPLLDRSTLIDRCVNDHNIPEDTLVSIEELLAMDMPPRSWASPRGFEVWEIPFWRAWTAFAERPWFERQWILQEFLLCPMTIIVCGDEFVDWRGLLVWTKHLFGPSSFQLNGECERALRDHVRIQQLTAQREKARLDGYRVSEPLDNLLRRTSFRGAKATIDHDYVFGLLGLVPQDVVERITVDYQNRSSAQVFMQAIQVSCFSDQVAARAALMWESQEMRSNMTLPYDNKVCSWCPVVSNTRLDLRGDTLFPAAFRHASTGLASDLITSARGRPGSTPTSVKLDVIVLDAIDEVVLSPFDGPIEPDAIPFMVDVLNKQTARWMDDIQRLWESSCDPEASRSQFLDDFFDSKQFDTFAPEHKMALYKQLHRFASAPVDQSLDINAVVMMAFEQALDTDQRIARSFGTCLGLLRNHLKSSYCLSRTGQFGRCLPQAARKGDLICVIPGNEYLHTFRQIDHTSDQEEETYMRVSMAWFGAWSINGPGLQEMEDLQTLSIV